MFISSFDIRAMVNFLINLRIFKSHYAMGKITRKRKNFFWLKKLTFERNEKFEKRFTEMKSDKMTRIITWPFVIRILMRELFSIIFFGDMMSVPDTQYLKWSRSHDRALYENVTRQDKIPTDTNRDPLTARSASVRHNFFVRGSLWTFFTIGNLSVRINQIMLVTE